LDFAIDFGLADFGLFDLGGAADFGFFLSLFDLVALATDDFEDFDGKLLPAAEAPTVDLDIFDVRLASLGATESFE